MWPTIHAGLLLAWILSSWKITIACKKEFNKFLKQYKKYKLINKVWRMNVNIANPWTFGEAKPNQITSMFHMLPLTWIYHMKMQNKLRMVIKARWKSKKLHHHLLQKASKKIVIKPLKKIDCLIVNSIPLF